MISKKACMSFYNLMSTLLKSISCLSVTVFYIRKINQLMPIICHLTYELRVISEETHKCYYKLYVIHG